ncbi:MFS transporter [Pseudomonas sp. LPB0260]|uniref:MFS transporter n=1 Tax=Pseudomonas sp. LPB0260 TaxID=2614442 RepID=UPI0015C263EA|nr:MFS transporter [Pseudomonas sp. LPB0260]QLC74431.1 MFS transporter [Pseudomonas sp. LPB0260]QLC77201.1 MFS transporter [Pseudomonas sp. LPB0260]
MIESDYLLAWSAYAVAALGCLLVWFRLTRWMWRYVREPLRLLVAVLLLTPTVVDPAKELLAPAVAVAALDLLFKVGNNALRAAADLAMYGLIAFALYLLFVAVRWPIERWWKRRGGPVREEREADAPTLRELMEQGAAEPGASHRDSRGERRLRIEPRL